MSLTDTITDIIAQAHRLLDTPDLRDWSPPEGATPEEAAAAEEEEVLRRSTAAVDAYLADRSDRLAMLRAVRASGLRRAEEYKAQAEPWMRLAKRQQRIVEHVERLGRELLEAERRAAGLDGEAYEVQLPNGIKMGIKLSPPSVRITAPEALPDAYWRTTREPVKADISRALKAGQEVPGAELVRGEHMTWGR